MNLMNKKQSKDDRHFKAYFDEFSFLPLPENPVVQNGIIVLTGGSDRLGKPLIVFPMEMHLKLHLTEVQEKQMVDALIFYFEITRINYEFCGIAFLVDFRASSKIIIDVILCVISSFNRAFPYLSTCFYGIQPEEGKLFNHIKKAINQKLPDTLKQIYSSDDIPKQSTGLISIFVKNSEELCQFIDLKFLTNDFGGKLIYNHKVWMSLNQDIHKYLEKVQRQTSQFPEIENKMKNLKEINTETSFKAMEKIEELFNKFVDKSRIKSLIDDGDSLLNQVSLSVSKRETLKYNLLRENPHLFNNQQLLIKVKRKLLNILQYFQEILNDIKNNFYFSEELKKFKDFAEDEVYWIKEIGIPHLRLPPRIATNCDEADALAGEFQYKIYTPGIKCLSKCDEIKDKIAKSNKSHSKSRKDSASLPDASRITDVISKFNTDLQDRRKLYSDIYQFHLVVTQLGNWLKKTIAFLPIELIDFHQKAGSIETVSFDVSWSSKTEHYLDKNPPPRSVKIELIETYIENIPDIKVENEARLLLFKYKLIMRLLSSDDVTLEDVHQVIDWKYQQKLEDLDDETEDINDVLKNIQSKNYRRFSSPERSEENSENDIGKSDYQMKEIVEQKIIPNKKQRNVEAETDYSLYQRNVNVGQKGKPYQDDKRSLELIEIAEKTVRESLSNANLISERDLRIPKFKNDEDELSAILNQLLYDISSEHESSADDSLLPLDGADTMDNSSNYSYRFH